MRLEQNMGMSQRMAAEQNMTQEQRLEMAQSMIMKMTMTTEGIRHEIIGYPKVLFGKVIKHVLVSIQDPQLKEGLAHLFEDEILLDKMLEQASKLSVVNKDIIKYVIANYIWAVKQGNFEVISPERSGEENTPLPMRHIPFGTFEEALNHPQKTQKDINDLQRITQQHTGDPDAIANVPAQIVEKTGALNTAEYFKDYVQTVDVSMNYLLSIKVDQNTDLPEIQDFLREMVILKKLDYTLSERIQKRFAANCSAKSKKEKETSYQTTFVNTVAEFALTSMGVIDPEVFNLKKKKINESDTVLVEEEFTREGFTLDQILQHYKLSRTGTIFWNRWNTLEQTPGKVTDERIRSFITKTVRTDQAAVLQACNWPDFYARISNLVKNCSSKVEDRKDLAVDLKRELTDLLSQEAVKSALTELIKTRWLPQLTTFYMD